MSTQQATIESDKTNENVNGQSTQEKENLSGFELAKDKDWLEKRIDDLLAETHGEVTDEINELFGELDDLIDNAEEKIRTYKWVKTKIEEEIEAWNARYKYHKDESKKRRDTRNARKNNLDNLKSRAAFLLSKMDDESIRIDGKKVYNRTYYKVSINDEEKAYDSLKQAGLAEKEFHLGDKDLAGIISLLQEINSQATDEETDEPKQVTISPDVIADVKQQIKMLKNLSGTINFAGGRDLNAHAKELCETAAEKKEKILSQIQSLRAEKEQLADDLTDEEIKEYDDRLQELHQKMDKIDRMYSIPGAEIDISKTPFGL